MTLKFKGLLLIGVQIYYTLYLMVFWGFYAQRGFRSDFFGGTATAHVDF
jgi:hypothetical protein